ncbi:hypothetical protein WJX79_000232 [Trebouxia sp. C0005]|nr:MAG: Mpv17-like isoform X1 [Trebouxia sp. A1-2]
MRAFGALRGFPFFGRKSFRRQQQRQQGNKASQAGGQPLSDGSSTTSWLTHPVMKAAYTSGSLSLAGDLIAQLYSKRGNNVGSESIAWDRSARMGTFGLFFYGPYQHWWYGLLNQQWPLKSTYHFLTKVTLNQLALGPIVTTVVFTWNLLLQQRASEVPDKLKRDLVPTMVNGWKFWVPAASINFWVVPLQSQVLYMSVCGLLWTAYLSYSSNSRPQLSKT